MQACRKNCIVLKVNILPRTVYRCVILHWFAANIDQYTQGTNEVSRLVAVLLQYCLPFVLLFIGPESDHCLLVMALFSRIIAI